MAETYAVNVTREEGAWRVEVPAIGRVAHAETLAEADEAARALVSVMTGLEPASIMLDVNIQLDAEQNKHIEGYIEQRRIADQASAKAVEEGRAAAKQLRALGITVRDIGRLLGVSHQRASQLANA